jgi:hypothetical protein
MHTSEVGMLVEGASARGAQRDSHPWGSGAEAARRMSCCLRLLRVAAIPVLVQRMGRLEFGVLSQAWQGEASDFTPLLADQLDSVGDAIGIRFAQVGSIEVQVAGGRRIDIVASEGEDSEFVIENQYGRADHDHLTRGLAYAVARRARGLVVIAEEHRDEFRAVAEYLNGLAETSPTNGIAIWLVEAKAVRIGDSPWAPLFTAVVEPNWFVRRVNESSRPGALGTIDELWAAFAAADCRTAAKSVLERWEAAGHRWRLGPNWVGLQARGPSKNGYRVVVALYTDGSVSVPFPSYAGGNTGIEISELTTPEFRVAADELFGFSGAERWPQTTEGWFTPIKVDALMAFSLKVAAAYSDALADIEE